MLRSGLEHAVVLLNRVDEVPPLGDGERQRLLGINVATRLEDVGTRQDPRMGCRLDEDRVELFLLEHLLIMLVRFPPVAAGNELGGLVAPRKKAIGHGHDLGAGQSFAGQDPPCPAPQANEAELDPVVGPRPPRGRQGFAGDQRGKGKRRCSRSRRLTREAIGDDSWEFPSCQEIQV